MSASQCLDVLVVRGQGLTVNVAFHANSCKPLPLVVVVDKSHLSELYFSRFTVS